MKIVLLVGLVINMGMNLNAQVLVSSGASFVSGPGGSVAVSIGESVTETYTKLNFSITQGFLQGGNTVISKLNQNAQDNIIEVYPNPVSKFLNVDLKTENTSGIFIKVYDTYGKLIISQNPEQSNAILNLSHLTPSVYFLKVIEKNKELYKVKIIKK